MTGVDVVVLEQPHDDVAVAALNGAHQHRVIVLISQIRVHARLEHLVELDERARSGRGMLHALLLTRATLAALARAQR